MNAKIQETTQLQPDSLLFTPAAPAQHGAHSRLARRLVLAAALAAAAGLSYAAWRHYSTPLIPTHATATVHRADIARAISATGHVQAVITVQVGSQVSGAISELHADFNDRVTKGQIIARLDPSQLQAQLTQTQASYAATLAVVQSAQNGVQGAEAAAESAKANVDRAASVTADAQRNYDLNTNLVKEGVFARRDLDTSRAALFQAQAQQQQAVSQWTQAKAQALAARSQLEQARAQSQQSKAAVEVAQVNLDRSVIRAPIDGVVVARNVDIGQTVAASLQAPTLFLIANDLTRMQVLADIDEADIGQLRDNAEVNFTVDAFPRDTFHGRVSQIRLSPQTVQNVVTYTAVIDVANEDLKLKPGMTANISAIVAQKKNVLTVPNAAFRFQPPTNPAAPTTAAAAPASARPHRTATVWTVESHQLKPVQVQTGMTDGIVTEIAAGPLAEGAQVAVPAQQANSRAAQSVRSPFSPSGSTMRGGRR